MSPFFLKKSPLPSLSGNDKCSSAEVVTCERATLQQVSSSSGSGEIQKVNLQNKRLAWFAVESWGFCALVLEP